jgi:hypothetical protein
MPVLGEHAEVGMSEMSVREPGARELSERELGEHFARISGYLLGGTAPDSAPGTGTGDLAIGNALLAIYWELRHQSATGTAPPTVPVGLDRLFPRKRDPRPYWSTNGRSSDRPMATEPGS